MFMFSSVYIHVSDSVKTKVCVQWVARGNTQTEVTQRSGFNRSAKCQQCPHRFLQGLLSQWLVILKGYYRFLFCWFFFFKETTTINTKLSKGNIHCFLCVENIRLLWKFINQSSCGKIMNAMKSLVSPSRFKFFHHFVPRPSQQTPSGNVLHISCAQASMMQEKHFVPINSHLLAKFSSHASDGPSKEATEHYLAGVLVLS